VAADPRDDFTIFEGAEHMFFGMVDPFGAMRSELTDQLRKQVADTEVESIRCEGEPKWLTIGKRGEDTTQLVVTYFGVCYRARVVVAVGYGREQLVATLTFLFGRWDDPIQQRCRTHFDFHGDAETAYADDRFRERFLAFRADDP
jgi:hypothetical protein